MINKLNKVFKNSSKITIDDNTKIVIMSDCHRGSGNNFDNFIKNKAIFEKALTHYYNKKFIYIELGDGDEMWEVKNYKDIVNVNLSTFKILKKFHDSHRLIMLYGNHDLVKKHSNVMNLNFGGYYNKKINKIEPLLGGLTAKESIILDYKGNDIFLIHGHQVDFINSTLWSISRILVRYVWKNIEHLLIKDPTGNAKNNTVSKTIEKKLEEWSTKNNKIIIAGHTHRPIFPKAGKGKYFNDGSCVHPNGITCLEIENGGITLVKWYFKENNKNIIEKTIIEKKEKINNYFNNT